MMISPLKRLIFTVSLLSIVLVLGSTTEAKAGNEYYVAKNGNDKADGSESNPWLTVGKAASTLVPGDTAYIKNGIYNENVTVAHSGSPGNSITFQAYSGHSPIIKGTGVKGTGTFVINGNSYIRVEGIEIKNGGDYSLLVNDSAHIDLANLAVNNSRLEAIQIRGASKYVTVDNCIVTYAGNYSGIDITKYRQDRPHHINVQNSVFYHNALGRTQSRGISSEQADNLRIDSNIVYMHDQVGIDIGSGDHNVVFNNIVYDCETGIALSSNEDSEVYNNTIYNITNEGLYSYYFATNGEDHARNKWHHNTVHNVGFAVYEDKRNGASSYHEFYNNLFYDVGLYTSRAQFYFRGSINLRFYNNTVYVNAGYDGLRLVEGSARSEIKNNIISVNGSRYALIIEDTSYLGADVDYNCYENRNGSIVISWDRAQGTATYTESDVNNGSFYNDTGEGRYSVATDPKFVNVSENNFHLETGSPCIDAGNPEYPVPPGGGSRIDMGAFEYVAGTTPPNPPTGLRIIR